MSLRNYLIKIPAGGFEKVTVGLSNFLLVKRTNATIPIIRITYDGGSNRLIEVKANHKFSSEKDFTEIEIDNSNGLVALDMLLAIGKGSYDQNESNVTVVNDATNPVQVKVLNQEETTLAGSGHIAVSNDVEYPLFAIITPDTPRSMFRGIDVITASIDPNVLSRYITFTCPADSEGAFRIIARDKNFSDNIEDAGWGIPLYPSESITFESNGGWELRPLIAGSGQVFSHVTVEGRPL